MTETPNLMVTAQEVINLTGVKNSTFGFDKEDTTSLYNLLEGWIAQSESLITSYCNNTFEDDVPLAVKNVCLRLSANMVAFAQTRKNSPVIKVNDWTIQSVGSSIFTEDLKEDLVPFIKERKSSKSDKIDFFVISGD